MQITPGNARKVLVVCTSDVSAAKLLAGQLKALSTAGYIVHVACAAGPHLNALEGSGLTVQRVSIVNRANPVGNLHTIAQLVSLMRRERYDVVHAHMISAGFLGRIAAWLAGVPTIFYTFRGFAFYAGAPWFLRWYNLLIERACTPVTDFFFCQSELNRRRAIDAGVVAAERSATIGNGIPLEEFGAGVHGEADAASLRRALRIPRGAKVVGFVGRLVREKGVFEFVEAGLEVLRRDPSALLLIVGDALSSDRSIRPELEGMVEGSGAADRVRFTGYRSDVAALYGVMDVFVLPSYREGMPRCIMEAMTAGLPVVATDIPGCQDQVIDGVTGFLVPPRDTSALAGAIAKLLGDDELRRTMGDAGLLRARREFDEQVVHARIVELYDLLVRGHRIRS